jgi:hypothetical protein
MTDLKKETLDVLESHNKSAEDVFFVTDGKGYISFEEFLELANFRYDCGFGLNIINLQLKVVGGDFWLERHEYDGSEWWEYKTLPTKPEKHGVLIKESEARGW